MTLRRVVIAKVLMNFNYLRYTYEPFHIWLLRTESFIAICSADFPL